MRWACLILILSILPTNAATYGDWQYRLMQEEWYPGKSNPVIWIEGYNGNEQEIVIPSEIEGFPVAILGWRLFYNKTNITSVQLPNSLRILIGGVFEGCSSLTSITIPDGVLQMGSENFKDCTGLANVSIPESVTEFGWNNFYGATNLQNISLPLRYLVFNNTAFMNLGIYPDQNRQQKDIAGRVMASSLASALATNTIFLNNLAQAILNASNNYGLATQSAITTATSNLATQSQILTLATKSELTTALAQSRADGINSVLSNPNLWTLYTSNQIQGMAIGDLVLTRTNGSGFVLNYDIEQSEDLVNWYPYQGFAMPLTNLPSNKAFVRIKAKQ
ncbi:leucine-rich repeat domain-containing protein [bacterium]|nr:leucine-rich repeat domain-containing protein [bacterium]